MAECTPVLRDGLVVLLCILTVVMRPASLDSDARSPLKEERGPCLCYCFWFGSYSTGA